MTDQPDDLDRTLCFCHNVSVRQVLEAIRSGADTHEKIQIATRASTGCTGCEYELLEILEAELKKAKESQNDAKSNVVAKSG